MNFTDEKYCSKTCYTVAQGRIISSCQECEKIFNTTAHKISIGKGKFCSRNCYFENKRKEFEKLGLKTKPKGRYTTDQWYGKLVYFGYKCYLCGISLKSQAIHKEHRKPLSRGGSNWIANIAPACEKCNRAKNSKTEKEFREQAQIN